MQPIRFDSEDAGTLEWVPPLEVAEYIEALAPAQRHAVNDILKDLSQTYLDLVSTVFKFPRPVRNLGLVAEGLTNTAREIKKVIGQ